jgi:adenylate cyclase
VSRSRKAGGAALGLGLTALVLALYLVGAPFLHLVELKAQDALLLARGPAQSASGQVAVVSVGERSLDELGRWPWPRELVARLVEAAADQGAATIGLDIGFFEPSRRLPLEAAQAMARAARQGRPISLEETVGRFHPDLQLARAIAGSPAQVVTGWFFHMSRQEVAHLPPEEIKERVATISRFSLPAVRYANRRALDFPFLTAFAPEPLVPVLLESSPAAGFFNVLPEIDGTVRRMPLVIRCRGKLFPSLALAVLARHLGEPLPRPLVREYGLSGLRVGGRELPVDEKGRLWLNLRGRRNVLPLHEAADLLAGRLPQGALAGKAVLMGATATGLHDAKPTALDPNHPALDLQAQTVDNLLAGDFLERPGWAALWDLAAMAGLGLLATVAMLWLPPLAGAAACAGLAAGYLGLGYGLFLQGHILRLVHPLLALALAAAGVGLFRYLGEEREKRRIREAFAHYLHPSVIAELMREPGRLNLGGEERQLTVLFSDLRGFVSGCQGRPPAEVASQLNQYLDAMAGVVLANQGVLDKFMGDAVMAFFGAPVAQPDHAARACRTALAMQAELARLNAEWESRGLPTFRMGIGLSTGPMIVGNMGSGDYFDYTVVGQAVNLGSRLEALTKELEGVDIIASRATAAAVAGRFRTRPLGAVAVRGEAAAVEVHELVAEGGGTAPDQGRA